MSDLAERAAGFEDLERNLWEDTYMASAATARFLETEYQETRAILAELDLAR